MTSVDANAKMEGAFLELIGEKPFSKITVNDIVERAGVHRNTFYYHYHSIPAMLSEICSGMIEKMFDVYKDVKSTSECFLPLIRYSRAHKSALLHVYHSEARPILIDYVHEIGRFATNRFVENVTEKSGISRQDKEILTQYCTAGIVGVWRNWVEGGMESNASDCIIRLGVILEHFMLEPFSSAGMQGGGDVQEPGSVRKF